MTHLGDRITPLVDSQLAPDVMERAHAHLAGCDECRSAVEAERLMKARLAMLNSPEPGDELMRRLFGLAGPEGPMPPRVGHVPGTPRPRTIARPPRPAGRPAGRGTAPAARGPGGRAPVRLSRTSRARVTAAMVGALCLVGVGVAGGVASSAAPGVSPTVVPPVDTFVVEHTLTTGTLPFGDQSVGWGSAGETP